MATMTAPKKISPKQSAYIATLIESREVPQSLVLKFTEDMTSFQASELIDSLKLCPWKNAKPQVKAVKTEIVGEGFYCVTEGLMDLVYYKVQTSQSSKKRYALVWTGKKWEFAPGKIYKITATDKLTAEQAKRFGKKTGHCVCCGRLLTVKASVEAGIGPVCQEKYGF